MQAWLLCEFASPQRSCINIAPTCLAPQISPRAAFYASAGAGLAGLLVTVGFLPDTTGLDLHEIDRMNRYLLADQASGGAGLGLCEQLSSPGTLWHACTASACYVATLQANCALRNTLVPDPGNTPMSSFCCHAVCQLPRRGSQPALPLAL